MTTDEASRYHLYEKARSVLDEAAADTLMTALPRDPDRFAKLRYRRYQRYQSTRIKILPWCIDPQRMFFRTKA